MLAKSDEDAEEAEADPMLIDEVTYKIIGAAMTVHRALGPGLLEKAYDTCMRDELRKAKLHFTCQVKIPVSY